MIIEQYLQTFRGKIIFNLEFYTQPHYQSSILYSKEKKKRGCKSKGLWVPGTGNQLRRAVKESTKMTSMQQTQEQND